MQYHDSIAVAQQMQSMGVDLVRDGFATWVREGLGFEASDESIDRALERVRDVMTDAGMTVHDLAYHIAAAMPARAPHAHIDAFGGSAWTME